MRLILLRHCESLWNKENRFTGWTDIDLDEEGELDAHTAGRLLKREGYTFDRALTSRLRRAIHTLQVVLQELGDHELPIEYDWRLNERHYGALQGLNKAEMAAKYGEKQVLIWRRSYDIRPPALERKDPRWPGNDPLYADLPKEALPLTECLKDVVERIRPYWEEQIRPLLEQGKRVLIVAHGNSLRALIKLIDDTPEEEIVDLNLPTGIPVLYEFDEKLRPVKHSFLGDPAEVERRISAVKNQGKTKR